MPIARAIPVALLAASMSCVSLAADVEAWKPQGISSPQFESHAAFDPVTGELYFVRSSPKFEGWRIFVSRCGDKGWTTPREPAWAGDGVEADPFFTKDGKSLYFISTRSVDGKKKTDLDIWRVDRDATGQWGAPVRLPGPVNTVKQEWFPRPGPDGWLYFGSNRPGGLGKTDIWRARTNGRGQWALENLGPAINTPADEYEPLISADGSRMILMAEGGLYESRRGSDDQWMPRVKLPREVNVNGTEIGALFSPSGKSLLFSRDTKGPDSGEFFVLREGGPEDWPLPCPAKPATP
jgi:WD40-like Beta Propeller Repeat